MKKRWAFTEDLLFSALLLAMVLVFLVLAFGYSSESRTFPVLVTVPLALGLAVQVVRSARVPLGVPETTDDSRRDPIVSAAWMIGLILIVWLVGMVPAMFVIPFIYMRFYCGESWRPTLVVSTILLVMTVGFMRWLHIPELQGVLFGLLDSVRDGLGT